MLNPSRLTCTRVIVVTFDNISHTLFAPKLNFKKYNFPFILRLGGAQIILKLIFNFKFFLARHPHAWCWGDENQHSLKKSELMTRSTTTAIKTIYNQPLVITKIVTILGLAYYSKVLFQNVS